MRTPSPPRTLYVMQRIVVALMVCAIGCGGVSAPSILDELVVVQRDAGPDDAGHVYLADALVEAIATDVPDGFPDAGPDGEMTDADARGGTETGDEDAAPPPKEIGVDAECTDQTFCPGCCQLNAQGTFYVCRPGTSNAACGTTISPTMQTYCATCGGNTCTQVIDGGRYVCW